MRFFCVAIAICFEVLRLFCDGGVCAPQVGEICVRTRDKIGSPFSPDISFCFVLADLSCVLPRLYGFVELTQAIRTCGIRSWLLLWPNV
jgi:hypothetical protein